MEREREAVRERDECTCIRRVECVTCCVHKGIFESRESSLLHARERYNCCNIRLIFDDRVSLSEIFFIQAASGGMCAVYF